MIVFVSQNVFWREKEYFATVYWFPILLVDFEILIQIVKFWSWKTCLFSLGASCGCFWSLKINVLARGRCNNFPHKSWSMMSVHTFNYIVWTAALHIVMLRKCFQKFFNSSFIRLVRVVQEELLSSKPVKNMVVGAHTKKINFFF